MCARRRLDAMTHCPATLRFLCYSPISLARASIDRKDVASRSVVTDYQLEMAFYYMHVYVLVNYYQFVNYYCSFARYPAYVWVVEVSKIISPSGSRTRTVALLATRCATVLCHDDLISHMRRLLLRSEALTLLNSL